LTSPDDRPESGVDAAGMDIEEVTRDEERESDFVLEGDVAWMTEGLVAEVSVVVETSMEIITMYLRNDSSRRTWDRKGELWLSH
jgi:hypothetical protein